MKIVLFVNSLKTFYWHRQALAEKLIEQGNEVLIITSKDEEIRKNGPQFNFEFIDLNRKGINPFQELSSLIQVSRRLVKFKPDILHNFTVKCVVYGSLASIFCSKLKVVNSITGLGSAFIKETLVSNLVRWLYKVTFKLSNSNVIFQNTDDMKYFKDYGLISDKRAHLILGSGVELSQFKNLENLEPNPIVTILFASRLIRDKGIVEFIGAIDHLHKKNKKFVAVIAGDVDVGNPSSLTSNEFSELIKSLPIDWKGHVHGMTQLIESSDIVCLPSYREGTPMILLEAAAAKKGIVATDVPGCRNVVVHEKTGLLAKVKDSQDLATQLERLLEDKTLRLSLGENAREHVENHFERSKILSQILSVYSLE